MYTTPAFTVDSSAEILGALRRIAFGHLVSVAADGPHRLESTPLPFVVDDELSEVRAHVARANQHWKHIDGLEALMIVAGPDAYISPRWYPSKAEHGRVVPTWNYEVIHLHGTIEIHDEPSWKSDLVTALTDRHEARVVDPERPDPWAVTDAPSTFVDAQLQAIVGVRMNITSIEAKRKLSQNRAADDRAGATAGLDRTRRRDAADTAELMRTTARS
jgi:transcriptional regulator